MSNMEPGDQPPSHGSSRKQKLRVRLRRSQFQAIASFAAHSGVHPSLLLRNGGLRRAQRVAAKDDPSITIDVRLTDDEKRVLDTAASKALCDTSTFVREGTMSIIAGVISRNPGLANPNRGASGDQGKGGPPTRPAPGNHGGIGFVR